MRLVSFMALAGLGSVAAADPSRSDRTVKHVYQISAQGSHTPGKSFNLANNKHEEPNSSNYVTPLGIRQQYMIGDELRYRYVEEQKNKFLSKAYDITQIFIQSTWNDTAILSAQAMLLGLYPPGANNYTLRHDQLERAVPPIEGFDFKPWIAELGNAALPYQTTIFPIQMNGWSYDYTLALDDGNCAKRKAVRQQNKAALDKKVADIVANAQVSQHIKETYLTADQWEAFCDYSTWAWLESVSLKEDLEKDSRAVCQALFKERANFNADLESSMSGVSTRDVRNHMAAQVKKWISNFSEPKKSDLKDTQLLETSTEKRPKQSGKKVNLEGTAGTENPSYIMFWTNEQMLELIASSLAKDDVNAQNLLPFSPSSTVLLEFTKETKNLGLSYDLYAQLYVNDQPVKTALCGGATKCTASAFADALEKTVADIEVASFCKA